MQTREKIGLGATLGVMVGSLIGGAIAFSPSGTDGARIVHYNDKVIMQTELVMKYDQIYISSNNFGYMTNLGAYLKTFTNEEARIKEEKTIIDLLK